MLVRALRNAFDAIEKHERWHVVGDTDEVTFENAWTNFGSGWRDAAFRRNALGDVQFFAVLTNAAPGFGGNNSAAWTFPEGYRPPGLISFPAVADDTGTFYPALVSVAATGAATFRVPALGNGVGVDQFHAVGRFRTQ